jgi:hypothetical protein
VPYDDLTDITQDGGLVTATMGESAARLELPEPVFPTVEVENLRRQLAGRPRADGGTARP